MTFLNANCKFNLLCSPETVCYSVQQILDLNRTMVTLRLSYLSITNPQRRCPTFDSGALFFARFVSRAHLKNALGSGVQGGTPGALLSPISWRVPRNRHKLKINFSFTFILCHSTKNEPRKRAKGCSPWIPRGFALPTRQGSKGLLSKIPRLVRHRLQDGWVRSAMPNFGEHVADIAKKGECGYKPFWKMEGGYLSS